MPQLNVLPISTSQNVDVMDESAAFTSTKSNENFSQLIDQHLANSPENRGSDQTSAATLTDKNKSEKLSQETTKQLAKTDDDSVGENKSSEKQALETAQQEVATGGKNGQNSATSLASSSEEQALLASEQLMSFLYKADNTLLAEPEQVTKTEQLTTPVETKFEHLSAEQKALYEAQLLLNGSNLVADLSGVAKALSTEALEQELAQNTADKNYLQSTSDARAMIRNGIAELPVEPIIKGKQQTASVTDTTEPTIKAESAGLLATKQINIAEQNQKLAAVSSPLSVIKTDQSTESIGQDKFEQVAVAKSGISSKEFIETSQPSKVSSAGENVLTQASKVNSAAEDVLKQEKRLIANFDVAKTQGSQSEKVAVDAASQFENTQATLNKKIAELAQTKQMQQGQSEESISLQARQVNTNQAALNSNANTSVNARTGINSDLSDINLDLLSKQEKSKVIASSQAIANQSPEHNNTQKSAEHRVNLSTQTMNETNDVSEQQFSKAQGQKAEQEHLTSKVLSQASEEVVLEDKSLKSVKAELSANASFTDISAKATQVAQQLFERQSADILSPAITTEVTQSQKTNAQLHQETIAIFRKDFVDAVKDKVMLMISQKLQRFDISLDPPELGNMQVRVNLQNEQAAVSFIVQNQQAKEALEQNMHKLRDMLAQQGVDVGDANVEQQSQQSDNENNFEGSNFQQGQDITQADDMVEHTLSANMINSSVNAIDYYA